MKILDDLNNFFFKKFIKYSGQEVQNSFERKKSLPSTKKVFRAQKKCLKRKKSLSSTKKVFRAQKKALAVVFQTKKNSSCLTNSKQICLLMVGGFGFTYHTP